jgi:hypothetical protein
MRNGSGERAHLACSHPQSFGRHRLTGRRVDEVHSDNHFPVIAPQISL